MAHSFDALSGFCTKCGQHESVLGDEPECPAGPNVVGMSHRTIRNRKAITTSEVLDEEKPEIEIIFTPDDELQKAIDEAP